jgi:hypothetical protein
MFHTEYKPAKEIEFSLRKYRRIAIISCNVCANLSDTGGKKGLKLMQDMCREWGKETVGFLVFGACVGSFMEYTVKRHIKPIRPDLDAIMVISCAGGVKSAKLYNPDLPVVAACDSFGSLPLTPRVGAHDSPIIHTVCPICEDGHCVMSYTAGICPVAACPLECRYGFCDNPPRDGEVACTEDPGRDCVWVLIKEEVEARGGDIKDLEELKQIHGRRDLKRMPTLRKQTALPPFMKVAKWTTGELFNPGADVLHWLK